MPRTNFKKVDAVSYGGFGKQGWCSLCSFRDPSTQQEYDQRVAAGWSPRQLNEWAEPRDLPVVSRDVIYNHRRHVANPKDRLVAAVDRRLAVHGTAPQKVTEDAFLDRIIAVGNQRAIDSPDEVTIDHALRAVQVKTQSKQKNGDQLAVLVQIFTALPPQMPVTEGEYTEVN